MSKKENGKDKKNKKTKNDKLAQSPQTVVAKSAQGERAPKP